MEKLVWRLKQIVDEKLVADKVTHIEVEQIIKKLEAIILQFKEEQENKD